MNNKVIPILVVLLIVASFMIGMLYTRVTLLEKQTNTTNQVPTGAKNQPAAAAAAPGQPAQGVEVSVDVTKAAGITGKDSAKVALIEFTDYQCPFCKQQFDQTWIQLKKDYIDTGKVKYFLKDYPLAQLHPYAQKSAEAARCAGEQDKYWEYHDVLFADQNKLQIDDLKAHAATLGLNTTQFNSCLDSGKYSQAVSQDQKQGEQVGVRGTPSSFVGVIEGDTVKAVSIAGAQPYATFKATIEDQLVKVN